jgi:beta-lactam-binding protein with PASTA domain
MIRRLVQSALVLGLLLAVALLSALATMHFAIHGAEVKVPDLRNMSVDEAGQAAAARQLEAAVEDRFYSAVVPAGRIVTQSPAPGTVVRTGWHVRLGLSLGGQRVAIPALLGQPQRAAELAIRRAGLQVGGIAHLPWAYTPPGTVLAQTPDAGAASVDRPVVSILVSDAVPPEQSAYVMPDFVNQPARSAIEAVTRAGFRLAPPLYRAAGIPSVGAIGAPGAAPAPPALPVVPDTVLDQRPPAGTRIEAGGTIQLTLAQ